MMRNPIFKRDELLMNRGHFLFSLLIFVNLLMAILVLLNLYSLYQRAMLTGEIYYESFLLLYYRLAAGEIILLLAIAPGLSAYQLSSEKERGTLELIKTTPLSISEIAAGKFMSCLSTMLTLGISTLPIMMTVFIYGGVGFKGLIGYLLLYVVLAVFSVSAGLMSAAFSKSSSSAALTAYIVIITTAALSILLLYYSMPLPLTDGIILAAGLTVLLLCSLVFLWICRKGLQSGER